MSEFQRIGDEPALLGHRLEQRDFECDRCRRQRTEFVLIRADGTPFRSDGNRICDECRENAWALHEAQIGKESAERRVREYEIRLRCSRLPVAMRYADAELVGEHVAGHLDAWVAGNQRGLLLYGEVGAGKSCAAAVGCMARLKDVPVSWVAVAPMMTRLKLSFDDDERRWAQALITDPCDTVLDDLDKVNPTEFGREVIYALVDSVVAEGLSLLVTTNLHPAKLAERLGDPIVSRLVGYCEVVKMLGDDRRLSGKGRQNP